jgi:hypothetical protein
MVVLEIVTGGGFGIGITGGFAIVLSGGFGIVFGVGIHRNTHIGYRLQIWEQNRC